MTHFLQSVRRVGHESPVTVYGSFGITILSIVIVALALIFEG